MLKYPLCEICQALSKAHIPHDIINDYHESKIIISYKYFEKWIVDTIYEVMHRLRKEVW